MATIFWVATHTGLPSVIPDVVGPVWAGDRLLTVVTEQTRGVPVSDPLAPVGEPVVYRVGDQSRSMARASARHHLITDASGHRAARITWLVDDSTDMGVSVESSATMAGVADRWPLAPRGRTWTMDVTTVGDSTTTLAALATRPGRVVVVHDPTICDVHGCDIEPIRIATVSDASHRRSGIMPTVRRRWSLKLLERETVGDATAPRHLGQVGCASPVVTWGEWRALDRTYKNKPYMQLVREIAGMPF